MRASLTRSWVLFALAAKLATGQSAIELARKAPPEIFADAVIKLVELGQIPPAQQRDLLKEAFDAAKHAHEPERLKVLPIAGMNSRGALRDSAGALGLDALSLESRVIKSMAAVDAARAREMFQSVEHPMIEPRSCQDPLIADASAYYETAGMLAGGQAPLFMLALGPATSPGELASFAKVLVSAHGLTPEDFRLISGALALKMETAVPDYRSFTMTADELRSALEAIAARDHELELSTTGLAESTRKLVIVQMSRPRCNEEFGDAAAFVKWFNGRFRGAVNAIEQEELEPPRALGFFKAPGYFESGEAKQIADDFGKLRRKQGTLADFLKEFSAWEPEGSDPEGSKMIDAFHQKMTVLHGLLQLIPAGADRDALLARTVEFLKSSGVEREAPAEWLLQVRSFAGSATIDRAKLLTAFRESGDAGLAVFAALEQVSAEAPQK